MSLVAQWIHICTMKVKALGFKSHEWPFLAETFSLMTAHLTLRIYLQWVSVYLCPWWLSGQACVPWMIRVLGSNPIDCCNGFEKTFFHHLPVPFQAWWESSMMGTGVFACQRPSCVSEGPTTVQAYSAALMGTGVPVFWRPYCTPSMVGTRDLPWRRPGCIPAVSCHLMLLCLTGLPAWFACLSIAPPGPHIPPTCNSNIYP